MAFSKWKCLKREYFVNIVLFSHFQLKSWFCVSVRSNKREYAINQRGNILMSVWCEQWWRDSLSNRFDKEGHALEGQSLTEAKGSGGVTNWKTLSDVKMEHLGHGDKVHACSAWPWCAQTLTQWWTQTYCYYSKILTNKLKVFRWIPNNKYESTRSQSAFIKNSVYVNTVRDKLMNSQITGSSPTRFNVTVSLVRCIWHPKGTFGYINMMNYEIIHSYS